MMISRENLHKICDMILDQEILKDESNFIITDDFYWNIVKEYRYNSYEEPSEFTMGQLSFDLEQLEAILARKHEPTPQALIWLGQILIAIGENS